MAAEALITNKIISKALLNQNPLKLLKTKTKL